jgi:hypothetical protein
MDRIASRNEIEQMGFNNSNLFKDVYFKQDYLANGNSNVMLLEYGGTIFTFFLNVRNGDFQTGTYKYGYMRAFCLSEIERVASEYNFKL